MEYSKGDVCGVDNCRARQYYTENGLLFCKNGHQKEGRIQTQHDDDDFGTQGRTTRRKREFQEKVSRIYRGRKAFELYLQCYQLILWKQCHSLVHEKGFPPELENVVHDLWALRLQLLNARSGNVSDTDEEQLLFSSQTEQTDTENEASTVSGKMGRKEKSMPGLIDTLGLCYLGAMLLRVPLSIGELHKWATAEDIPYIRAIRLVPKSMKTKLHPQYISSLDLRVPLRPDDLHNSVQKLAALYYKRFHLSLPTLNYSPLLFKLVRDLALPLECFTAVRHISATLGYTYNFSKPGNRHHLSSLPEIRLVSLLVIAVKLYHPFDSVERYLGSLTETGYLIIDWNTWCKVQEDYQADYIAKAPHNSGNEIMITEDDVFNMSNTQLDNYMDWYEKMWVDEEGREPSARSMPQQMLDMFPTGRPDGPATAPNDLRQESKDDQNAVVAKLMAVQNNLKTRGIVSEERESQQPNSVRRIGSMYKRYRREEDLPPQARIFYTAAARMGGMSVPTLVKAVFKTELALQRWKDEQDSMESADHEMEDLALAEEHDDALNSDTNVDDFADVESDDTPTRQPEGIGLEH